MKKMHVRYVLIALALTAIIVIPISIWIATTFVSQSDEANNVGDTVVVTGMPVCLPHKNTDGPQTLECAIGIHDDESGYYYQLKNIESIANELDMNKRIAIEGTIEAVPEGSIYAVMGTLVVQRVIK